MVPYSLRGFAMIGERLRVFLVYKWIMSYNDAIPCADSTGQTLVGGRAGERSLFPSIIK